MSTIFKKAEKVNYVCLPGLIELSDLPIELDKLSNEEKISCIETVVLMYYSVKMEDVLSKKRYFQVTSARQAMMYFMRTILRLGVVFIGRRYNRDHTTVIHTMQAVTGWMETDKEFLGQITLMRKIIFSRLRDAIALNNNSKRLTSFTSD